MGADAFDGLDDIGDEIMKRCAGWEEGVKKRKGKVRKSEGN